MNRDKNKVIIPSNWWSRTLKAIALKYEPYLTSPPIPNIEYKLQQNCTLCLKENNNETIK